MDQSQKLAILLTMAEEQTAANAALQKDLKEQIAALARATQAANQAVEAVKLAANDVQPAVKSGAAQAVEAGVGTSLKNVGDETKTALENALKPIIGGLAGAARSANDVEAKLDRVTASFGWKWALVAGGSTLGMIAAALLIAWGTVWYQRSQVEKLVTERNALQAEVVMLKAGAEDWAKRAGRAQLNRCNQPNNQPARLCVQVDPAAGTYGDSNKGETYMVIKNY
ncbi:hypothetical protein HQN60_15925 (plasmid) [Deefgea piscis]|uniref:Uncharacterized protein n=1 Tax=Deefgea piscis TaxID=2739061 RepID=A0A6M8T2U0_9NEIS|nr:hypothetical protein [Deefgea piscis]QKJ68297.1 hypothetical protein HQN60_15925 [Deefgea piscis]